jgi:hypothetical protein
MNLISYTLNLVNGSTALFIVVLWCFTKSGSRGFWKKVNDLIEEKMTALLAVLQHSKTEGCLGNIGETIDNSLNSFAALKMHAY